MLSVFTARGMLIESQLPTWLWATASEHAVMYQFNFNGAMSVFGGLLQTESPYFQPKPSPPAPYESAVGVFPSDPGYNCNSTGSTSSLDPSSGCDASWAIMITESSEIHIASAGLYSWFSDYTQDCINAHKCQQALVYLSDNLDNIRLENLVTIGANNSLVDDDGAVPALDNVAVLNNNASWSQISIYLATSDDDDDDDDDSFLDSLLAADDPCDYSAIYDTLDDLLTDVSLSNVPAVCGPGLSLPILSKLLDEAVDK
jgi:hypothetical protein